MVYILRDRLSRVVKIGCTEDDLLVRWHSIQSLNKNRYLELIGTLPGSFELENELHKRFEEFKIKGHKDWFEFPKDFVLRLPRQSLKLNGDRNKAIDKLQAIRWMQASLFEPRKIDYYLYRIHTFGIDLYLAQLQHQWKKKWTGQSWAMYLRDMINYHHLPRYSCWLNTEEYQFFRFFKTLGLREFLKTVPVSPYIGAFPKVAVHCRVCASVMDALIKRCNYLNGRTSSGKQYFADARFLGNVLIDDHLEIRSDMGEKEFLRTSVALKAIMLYSQELVHKSEM